jgi:hypothetical protein
MEGAVEKRAGSGFHSWRPSLRNSLKLVLMSQLEPVEKLLWKK